MKRKITSSPHWLLLFGMLISILWVYRGFFISRGNLIAGDSGDPRFMIEIMEHWLHALVRGDALRSPLFFYPATGLLGYSDCFLLFVPPYGFFRLLGLDYFLAYELAVMCFTAIACVSVYFLFHRGLGFRPSMSAFSAVLFACSSMTYCTLIHAHLFSVAVPLASLGLAITAYRSRRRGPIAVAGLLLGLQAATCYYIAWSFVFLGCLFAAALVFLLARYQRESLGPIVREAIASWQLPVAGALGFFLGLIPFLYIFVPVYRRLGGGWTARAAYGFLPELQDFFNTSAHNLLWGRFVVWFCRAGAAESFFGWPPGLALAAVLGGVVAFHRLRSRAQEPILNALVLSGVVTWLAGYLLCVNVGGHSPWGLVYRLVPGSSGLRVPQRMNMISNVFVCLAAAYFLRWLLRMERFLPRTRAALVSVLTLFFMVEQLNTGKSHDLNRPEELDILRRVTAPPTNCSVFFITKPAMWWRWPPTTQLDAMLTAERFKLPTVNGYSSNFPKSWDLMELKGDYQSRAIARALSNGSVRDVCGLDMETGRWKPALRKEPVEIIFGQGFSPPEKNEQTFWRWVDGREGILELRNNTEAPLTVQFRTIVNPAATTKAKFDLTIGGRSESMMISRGQLLQRTIDLQPGRTELRFKSYAPRVVAPNDSRYLVFGLEGWTVSVP